MKRKLNLMLALGLLGFLLLGCAAEKDYLVKIETRHGDMYAVFFDETPLHKQNFIDLAAAGRFDSTEFHRVIHTFMLQGGDVFGKEKLPTNEWPTIPAEIKPGLFHSKGMIAAARQGDNINPERKSNGSQFYIIQGKVYEKAELVTDMKLLQDAFNKYIQLESQLDLRNEYIRLYQLREFDALNQLMLEKKEDLEAFYSISLEKPLTAEQIKAYITIGGTPHLDGEYTVFGKIIKGMDVIDKIAAEKTGDRDKPLNPILMKVSVEKLSKAKITKEFGKEYN